MSRPAAVAVIRPGRPGSHRQAPAVSSGLSSRPGAKYRNPPSPPSHTPSRPRAGENG